MDFISHGLWGGVILGRENVKTFAYAFMFSVLPDILAEGVMFGLLLMGLDNMPGLEHGHPNITEFPAFAQNFYNATHSLIVFAGVFSAVWLMRKRPFWPLAAWGIHILIDIPTHSLALFPTPFLWPVSNVRVDGVPWDDPYILTSNIALLCVVYFVWFYRRKTKEKAEAGRHQSHRE